MCNSLCGTQKNTKNPIARTTQHTKNGDSSTTWKGRPLKTQKRSTPNENSKIPPNDVNEESMNQTKKAIKSRKTKTQNEEKEIHSSRHFILLPGLASYFLF